jgi:hypothetical protein
MTDRAALVPSDRHRPGGSPCQRTSSSSARGPRFEVTSTCRRATGRSRSS